MAHATSQPIHYYRASIRHDGRVLAVGTEQGVVIWDLAQGTELGFLGIGLAWHSLFEESGDLLTNGSLGVLRWPVQVDQERGVVHIGPPSRLSLPSSDCEIAEDRLGRIVAVAHYSHAHVLTPERAIPGGAARRLPRRRRQPGRGMAGDRHASALAASRSGASATVLR